VDVQPPRRVLYVATGERHIREAARSLESLWRHEPTVHVTMYIDGPGRTHLPEISPRGALEVLDHPDPTYSWADKPRVMPRAGSEGELVLFLDTDTRVCGAVTEIFEVLGAFDVAAAHAPIRLDHRQPASLAGRVPSAFPELNTGVIAFRRTAAVARFLERWRTLHLDSASHGDRALGDQAAFRVALYESDLRVSVLPPEYNCRFTFPTYVHGPVRILHGRDPDLERIERELNGSVGPRVFVPGVGVLRSGPTGPG
jgi:hypothetical protein